MESNRTVKEYIKKHDQWEKELNTHSKISQPVREAFGIEF